MTLEERAYALVEEAKATARIVIVGASRRWPGCAPPRRYVMRASPAA